MTWYELWLFLHIAAVVLWIGGAVAVQVFAALVKASGDPARSAAFGKDTGVLVRRVFMPASLVVLVSGATGLGRVVHRASASSDGLAWP